MVDGAANAQGKICPCCAYVHMFIFLDSTDCAVSGYLRYALILTVLHGQSSVHYILYSQMNNSNILFLQLTMCLFCHYAHSNRTERRGVYPWGRSKGSVWAEKVLLSGRYVACYNHTKHEQIQTWNKVIIRSFQHNRSTYNSKIVRWILAHNRSESAAVKC